MKRYNFISIILFCLILLACKNDNYYQNYEEQLSNLREKFYINDIKSPRFFYFGMGNRKKYLYKDGIIYDLLSNKEYYKVEEFLSDSIEYDNYTVLIQCKNKKIRILENTKGVFIIDETKSELIQGTNEPLNLPDFKDYKYDKVLKVLHHEILINIKSSKIYPNFLVYKSPWYRDAAVAIQCLEKTDNLELTKKWVLSINKIYDEQAGIKEADNPGQVLFLLSFYTERRKSFVDSILNEIEKITVKKNNLIYISGMTDGVINNTYQNSWLELGLKKLDINNISLNYKKNDGPYYDLVWQLNYDKTKNVRSIKRYLADNFLSFNFQPYPYKQWARAHYYNNYSAPFSTQNYPLSWEKGGKTNFNKQLLVDSLSTNKLISYTHVWTASEMFLYLIEFKK